MMNFHRRPDPLVLCILDGWGVRGEVADNGIAAAKTPVWHRLLRTGTGGQQGAQAGPGGHIPHPHRVVAPAAGYRGAPVGSRGTVYLSVPGDRSAEPDGVTSVARPVVHT